MYFCSCILFSPTKLCYFYFSIFWQLGMTYSTKVNASNVFKQINAIRQDRPQPIAHKSCWPCDPYTHMYIHKVGHYSLNNSLAPIHLLYKSHNASLPYPTMHHFVTEMCTCVLLQNGALWDIYLMLCAIYKTNLFSTKRLRQIECTHGYHVRPEWYIVFLNY